MQFESKPVRLPGHAQPEPQVRSQEDADSPPTMKLQGLLLGGLLLSSSTYGISPSSVFCMFPHAGVFPKRKAAWEMAPIGKSSLASLQIWPQCFCSFGSVLSMRRAGLWLIQMIGSQGAIKKNCAAFSLCDVRFSSPSIFLGPASLKLLPGRSQQSHVYVHCLPPSEVRV